MAISSTMPARGRRAHLRPLVSALAVVSLFAAGCSGSSLGSDSGAGAGSTIKIGFIADVSGNQKEEGVAQQQGVQLYLDTHGGKLGGHKIKLETVDETEQTAQAQAGLNKLIKQDQVSALLGLTQSATMLAAEPMVDAANIPMIGSLGFPSKLKGQPTHIWSTSWKSTDFGESIGAYVAKQVNGGTVFALGPDMQGGHDQISGFVDAFTKAGGKLANSGGAGRFTKWPPDTMNFQPILSEIQNSGAKAVYVFYPGGPGVQFIKQYQQFGLKNTVPLYATGSVTEGSALTAEGPAADGIKNTLNYAVDLNNTANRTFVTAYQKKYGGMPTAYSMCGYDSAAVLDKAIAKAGKQGTVSGQTINDAIGKLGQIDSPRGAWEFGKDHTPVQKWYLRDVKSDGGRLSNVLVQNLTSLGA